MSKPNIYLHGDIGDILLHGFYLKSIVESLGGKANLLHGTGFAPTKICTSLYDDLRNIGIEEVIEVGEYTGQFYEDNIREICLKRGFPIDVFIGYPFSSQSLTHIYRRDKNIFYQDKAQVNPRQISLFRFSGKNREWVEKNRPYEEWEIIERKLLDLGYDLVLLGTDDPHPNKFSISDLRNKCSLKESINILLSSAATVSVQSWPSVIAQHYIPTFTIFDATWYSGTRQWEDRYFGRFSHNFYSYKHTEWLDKLFIDFTDKFRHCPIVENELYTETGLFKLINTNNIGTIIQDDRIILNCNKERKFSYYNTLQTILGFR